MASIKEARGAAHTRILGVGGYWPSRVVTNDEICTWIDSSDEWIRTRTGIATRRWATPEETVVEMSVQAAGGATRGQLRRVAETALRGWPTE